MLCLLSGMHASTSLYLNAPRAYDCETITLPIAADSIKRVSFKVESEKVAQQLEKEVSAAWEKYPNLVELDFAAGIWLDDDLVYAARTWPQQPAVEKITIEQCYARDGARLAEFIRLFPRLKKLHVYENWLDAETLRPLFDELKSREGLTSFQMPCHDGQNKQLLSGGQGLADFIISTRTLTHFALGQLHFTTADWQDLCMALAEHPAITDLAFIGVVGKERNDLCYLINNVLMRNKTITSLTIRERELEKKDIDALVKLVVATNSLQQVDLSSNRLGDQATDRLIDALAANKSITALNLRGNILYPESMAKFQRSMYSNKTLHTLNLSENPLKEGSLNIACAVAHGATFQHLNLSHSGLDKNDISLFFETLLCAKGAVNQLHLEGANEGLDAATEDIVASPISVLHLDNEAKALSVLAAACKEQYDDKNYYRPRISLRNKQQQQLFDIAAGQPEQDKVRNNFIRLIMQLYSL
jgi:hypothetical protein